MKSTLALQMKGKNTLKHLEITRCLLIFRQCRTKNEQINQVEINSLQVFSVPLGICSWEIVPPSVTCRNCNSSRMRVVKSWNFPVASTWKSTSRNFGIAPPSNWQFTPKNQWLDNEISLWDGSFSGMILVSWRVIWLMNNTFVALNVSTYFLNYGTGFLQQSQLFGWSLSMLFNMSQYVKWQWHVWSLQFY